MTVSIQGVREDIQRALGALPSTSSQVAEHLHSMGVTGKKGSPSSCPIACYLKDAISREGVDWIGVAPDSVIAHANGGRVQVQMSEFHPHVSLFVDDFDNGRYPELEE